MIVCMWIIKRWEHSVEFVHVAIRVVYVTKSLYADVRCIVHTVHSFMQLRGAVV